jgi:murein DD-endopeptidase MepM/ murein hydrolase activator NlpD
MSQKTLYKSSLMKYFILSLLIILSGCAPLDYNSGSNTVVKPMAAPAVLAYCKPQPPIQLGPTPEFTQTYTIKSGDNLWQLARKFNVSADSLMRLNGIDTSNSLTVGRKIIVPETKNSYASTGFCWPVKGKIIEFYGERNDNIPNSGINIKAAAEDVLASSDGSVIFSDYINGWGKTLILKHNKGFYTIYANLSSASVKTGDYVTKKTVIGSIASGEKGNNILHFEIRKQYYPQNPLKYLE